MVRWSGTRSLKALCLLLAASMLTLLFPASAAVADTSASHDKVVLRICNWEEYIDEGGWDEDETIDLDSGDIIGETPMIREFEEWYEDTYGVEVVVEYSTFGTNEDLYNMLTMGDVYDLVCPSEYMFMKLMAEGALYPLSEHFFDQEDENNYYINGVSPYIRDIFDLNEIGGESWSKYAAGYMWGITGLVYDPEAITEEEASTLAILTDPEYYKKITIKDNVRDSYFAAVGAIKHDLLTSEEFLSDPDYKQKLEAEMNDVSDETIAAVLEFLREAKENAYSFETDSGKADMVTGKVVANYQWSGDATYSIDQAEEDDYVLNFAVPVEATNIYFDAWVMLRKGVEGDSERQHAAEAFINYISRPDNVIRNMYYIGYTSVIAGSSDGRILEYVDWNYGADEEEDEEIFEYDLGYFFEGEDDEEDYIIEATQDRISRQLRSMYPSEEDMQRSSIMTAFDSEATEKINKMWIEVRCFNILDTPLWVWIAVAAVLAAVIAWALLRQRRKY